jgi:hypothetical protein
MAGERVGDRVGREARGALLAVRDDRRAGRFHALDRIEAGGVLFALEIATADLARVISRISGLQLGRPRQGADGFGRNRHVKPLLMERPSGAL